MPDSRTLPIPAEHREFTVKTGGRVVPREHQLLSASVVKVAGKIAWAHLKEFPDYYTRLDKLEAEADEYWATRR